MNFGPFWVKLGVSDVTKGVKIWNPWNSDITIGFVVPIFTRMLTSIKFLIERNPCWLCLESITFSHITGSRIKGPGAEDPFRALTGEIFVFRPCFLCDYWSASNFWSNFNQYGGPAQCPGRAPCPIGPDPKKVPGIFTFCDVYGFHFKSQKPWSDGKLECY